MLKEVASLVDGIDEEALLTGTWFGAWMRVYPAALSPTVEANITDVLDEQSQLTLRHLRDDRGYVGDFIGLEYVMFQCGSERAVGWRARFRFEPRGGA